VTGRQRGVGRHGQRIVAPFAFLATLYGEAGPTRGHQVGPTSVADVGLSATVSGSATEVAGVRTSLRQR